MSTIDQEIQELRIEFMQGLKEINKDGIVDSLTEEKEHQAALKKIEGRVLGFFKGSKKFEEEAFEYYLFQLGDLTKVDRLLGEKELGIYNEKNGLRLNGYKYEIVNTYVEYAKQLKEKLLWQMRNRKGVDKELGPYQRNVRNGFMRLEETKIGAADRARMLMLSPHLMYKKKFDINQIADIWGIARPNAVVNIKKLTSEESGNVMIEDKIGNKKLYSFNPKYTFSGAGNDDEKDVKVYVNFLEEVIQKVKEIEKELAIELGVKNLKHSALATLHAIIPYFHYETCYAVHNADISICEDGETIEEARERYIKEDGVLPLDFLNVDQISKIVSKKKTDRNYINRSIYTLEKAGAIKYTDNTILINPKLMWALNDTLNTEMNPVVKDVLWQFTVEKSARKQKRKDNKKKEELVKKKSSAKTRIEE